MPCKCFTASSSCEPLLWVGLGVASNGIDMLNSCDRLLFMTYNGWIMISVAIGAFVGYLAFGNLSSTKSVACH